MKAINTSAFVDVMARQFGYNPRYVLMNNVKPLNDGNRLVARAITVRYLPARPDFDEIKPKNEKSPEYAAFEIAGPGDVIVMDSMETSMMSIGGDIKFLRLKQKGIDDWCVMVELGIWARLRNIIFVYGLMEKHLI